MADKNLKKQLEGIFADLEKPLKPANILALTEGGDEENQEDEYQLEKLFSKPEETLPPPKPIKPLTPVEMEPQPLQPIIGTPPVHQAEPKFLSSKPEDSFPPPKPATPPTPAETPPPIEEDAENLFPEPEDSFPLPDPPTPVEMEPPQPQPISEISPTFEEDLESLFPESEGPFPAPEPTRPTPAETPPTFEEDLESLFPEPEGPFPAPEPIRPIPAETPSTFEEEPGILLSEPEESFSPPEPAAPAEMGPQQLQPIVETPPVEIKQIGPSLQSQPKEGQDADEMSSTVVEDQVQSETGSEFVTTEEPQDVEPISSTVVEDQVQSETEAEFVTTEEPQDVEPISSTVVEDQVQSETEAEFITTEEVQEVKEPTSPTVIEDDVVRLLKSTEASERREAVQNLARMQNAWNIDPLLYAATDKDQEVARLALEGLLEMSVAVKDRILSLPQEYPTPLHLGGAAFISCLVGQPFVYIAPGPFLMGSDPTEDEMADSKEQPQHELSLPGYWIARYPVTASHFQTFLDESGYRPSQDDRDYGHDNYPVVDVTWNDALTYCLWLAQRTGLKVSLPSEAEWEKAARGRDGRRYPWGDTPPTAALYNPNKLTPVGQYSPQGDSPYGCADMVSNVWEWTRTIYEPYPYNPEDGRANLEGDKARAIRGLAFNNPEKFARCTARYRLKPILHLRTLGFRVVISPV